MAEMERASFRLDRTTVHSVNVKPTPPPTQSTGNTMLVKKRKSPLVVATRSPESIIEAYLGEDKGLFIKHLSSYQKSGVGWDEYRKKIPDTLLIQWVKAFEMCRKQGYLSPTTEGEILYWKQIVGSDKYADPCSVCPNAMHNGTCNGGEIERNGNIDFQPCWR